MLHWSLNTTVNLKNIKPTKLERLARHSEVWLIIIEVIIAVAVKMIVAMIIIMIMMVMMIMIVMRRRVTR